MSDKITQNQTKHANMFVILRIHLKSGVLLSHLD